MYISVMFFEGLLSVLFIICISHAARRGKQYVVELAVAAIYGILLELLTMIQLKSHMYGDFLITIFNAPVAIGFGWAVIIYTAMATTDRLGMIDTVKPFTAALLALNIDLSMDAIAIREGFWTWGHDGIWFGVPLGNFFAWFIVVSGFSYFIYRFRNRESLENAYPVLAMILSVILLLVLDYIWVFYLTSYAHIVILTGMIAGSLASVFLKKGILKKGNAFDWKILSVPLAFHVFFLTLLLIRPYRIAALVLISISMLILGLSVHLLPSYDTLRKKLHKAIPP